MKVIYIALALAIVTAIEARTFKNPILDGNSYASAIKVNDTYYVVAHTRSMTGEIFPIFSSKDLETWKAVGYIFDRSYKPEWAENVIFSSPQIHRVGSAFVLYFGVWNTTTLHWGVGIASSPHIMGPYASNDPWILAAPDTSSIFAGIIQNEGELYLLWSNAFYSIMARQLHEDGLSFASEDTTTLFRPNLASEGDTIQYPWYVPKGSYHFLIYTMSTYKGSIGIGVARSEKVLGPYEKLPDIIIPSTSKYSHPYEVSVVKDTDNDSDLIFFNAQVNRTLVVVLASMGWSPDSWPEIGEF